MLAFLFFERNDRLINRCNFTFQYFRDDCWLVSRRYL